MKMATISWPLANFTITQEFHSGHTGIDLAAPMGTPIYAADDGIVDSSGDGADNGWMGAIAGLYVLIRHSWGYTGYAHVSSYVVYAGQSVKRGQVIAYVGSTGMSTGPHCHFETLPLNPNWSVVSGRVNPRSHTIIPFGGEITPPPTPSIRKNKKMFIVFYADAFGAGQPGWNVVGTPRRLILTSQDAANNIARQLGIANAYICTSSAPWNKFLAASAA